MTAVSTGRLLECGEAAVDPKQTFGNTGESGVSIYCFRGFRKQQNIGLLT